MLTPFPYYVSFLSASSLLLCWSVAAAGDVPPRQLRRRMDNATLPDPLAPQNIATALQGPYLAGWSAQLLFSGVAVTLFYNFVTSARFSHLTRRTKIVVYTVVVLNTVSCVFSYGAIVRWGSYQGRTENDLFGLWILDVWGPLPSILLSTIVQITYANRVVVLFQRRITKYVFSITVGLFISSSWLGAITTLTWMFHLWLGGNIETSSYFGPWYISNTTAIWLMSAAAVDVTISSTLWFLLRSRVAGFNKSTDNMLSKLGRLAIQSASYTAVIALLAALLSVGLNGANEMVADIPAAFWLPLPSLYTISLFTTLSAQDRLATELRQSAFRPSSNQESISSVDPSYAGGRRLNDVISAGLHSSRKAHFMRSSPSSKGGITSLSSGIEVDVEVQIAEDLGEGDYVETKRGRW